MNAFKFLDVFLLDGFKLIKWARSPKGTKDLNNIMEKGEKFISLFNFKGDTVVVVCFNFLYHKLVVILKHLYK